MEWYFSNEVEDFVVPKDYGNEGMISSQETWSQWGISQKNYNSNNASMSQELYNNGGSLLWNDEADFQHFAEQEARINHMDDIFFSSLLEGPTKDSSERNGNTTLGNEVNVEDEMTNSQYVGQSIGSSKCLQTHDFSQSTNYENGEVSTSYQMPKQSTSNEDSMEESVLNDLERVTSQFTERTRICFRDAFYRLAESSKQPLISSQDGESMMASSVDALRAEDSESKTNVIDRAVASLMFHKFDFEEEEDYYDDDEQLSGY